MNSSAVGIDLGGSFIKGVLVNTEGAIHGWEKIPTEKDKGVEHVLLRIQSLISVLRDRQECAAAVGVGIPGMLDLARKTVILAPNLEWRNIELKDRLGKLLNAPVFLDNDANVAALGEAWLGTARNSSNFMFVTIGTGIGSGLVLGGNIFRGSYGLAAELGHMQIKPSGPECSCGQKGCLETLVSAPAIIQMAKEAGIVAEDDEAKDVMDLSQEGSEKAAAVIEQAMEYLAVGLKNAIVLLDLDLIVVGGGIGESSAVFIEKLKNQVADLLPVKREVRIVQASLGNKAGALGAARLAFLEQEGTQLN